MFKITIYIKPHRLEAVKSAIAALGVSGLTVSDVRGTGNSPEQSQWFAGQRHVIPLPVRSKLEVAVPGDMKDAVINAVLETAATGDDGDGKLFVERLSGALRVRTGEKDELAL